MTVLPSPARLYPILASLALFWMSAGASLQDLNVDHQCELLPDRVFVHKPIDNPALSYELGCAGTALLVYDRIEKGTGNGCAPRPGRPGIQAHYYTFIAEACQPVLLQLAIPNQGARINNNPLHMILIGPGLPRRRRIPSWVQRLPGDGILRAKQKKGQLQADLVTQTQFRVLQEIRFTAPVRGRFVLIIYTDTHRPTNASYRILLSGERGCRWGNLLQLPYQWLQTNLFVWQRRAIARLITILLGILAIIGFWHLRWRKKVAARGSFVG